jgi:hypothetical protein
VKGVPTGRFVSGLVLVGAVAYPLPDNDQAHRVTGIMFGVVALGAMVASLIAWTPARRPE